MRLTLERRKWIWAYLFLAVPLIFFLSIRIGPTLFAFWMSLHEWDPIALDRPFIGLENYREVFDDEVFWKAFRNTWIYVVVGVPAGLLFSLVVALGLQRLIRFVGFYRVLYFIPYITSLVAVGWVWRWMYTPNGVFNDVLSRLGLPQSGFLGDPGTAIYAIIATTVWQGLGFQIVIFLAGLESIPGDYLDAASVDGASGWQTFRDIVMPLLNPTIVFLVVTGVISNLQVFTQIRSMSSAGTGGPLDSTISVVLYVYQAAFQSLPSEMGYAAAMMVVLFVVILLITVVQLKFLSRGAYD
ncbi:MAG: sugar ABC transporter permease [Chloroflexia bacterium]|jgi:multiple sugar transport system permease protein|nr:sugar ABC transporter permease [Chloroflexia bacterium]MDQ3614705.1 sugar ABC transporter permease [Chloroflexota bacterium]